MQLHGLWRGGRVALVLGRVNIGGDGDDGPVGEARGDVRGAEKEIDEPGVEAHRRGESLASAMWCSAELT